MRLLSQADVIMGIFSLLASLLVPACAASAAAGLPLPGVLAPVTIVRPATPNSGLAGPARFAPAPDIIAPLCRLPAPRLFAAIEAVAASRPRTSLEVAYPADLQADYVVRRQVFNFPDLVLVAAEPRGSAHAALPLYSRSVYGFSDSGANRARVGTWLALLDRRLAVSEKR